MVQHTNSITSNRYQTVFGPKHWAEFLSPELWDIIKCLDLVCKDAMPHQTHEVDLYNKVRFKSAKRKLKAIIDDHPHLKLIIETHHTGSQFEVYKDKDSKANVVVTLMVKEEVSKEEKEHHLQIEQSIKNQNL